MVRRDGVLFVWSTDGTDDPAWGAWGCDRLHSGACVAPASEPPPPPPPPTEPPPTEPPVTSTPEVGATGQEAGDEVAAGVASEGSLPVTGRDVGLLLLIALACQPAVRRAARPDRAARGDPRQDRSHGETGPDLSANGHIRRLAAPEDRSERDGLTKASSPGGGSRSPSLRHRPQRRRSFVADPRCAHLDRRCRRQSAGLRFPRA